MANEARGEFDIDLEGVPYGMRPSYDAIAAYEELTGKSNAELYLAAARNTLRQEDAAAVVTECCKAWGRATGNTSAANFNQRRVGELLMEGEGGMLLVKKRLENMLFMAETGGITSTGEAKAVTITTTTEAAPAPVSAASPVRPSGGRRASGGKARR